jgi:hypothetical protein
VDRSAVIDQIGALLDEHYVFADIGAQLRGTLAAGLADGRYDYDELPEFAAAVSSDMQSANGDLHLRVIHHAEALPQGYGDDTVDLAWMAAWADSACGGVARVERLPGDIGRLELGPVLFPTAVAADAVAGALAILASADALLLDLRGCLGGEPTMVAMICGSLFDEPTELSGMYERAGDKLRQMWSLPAGQRRIFGGQKPIFVLTGPKTFSGGEALAYDLQALGRATVVGERTRGGAHPRRGFRVHPHLEVAVPVARSVHPITGTNWEGVGVAPDVEAPAGDALRVAYELALRQVAGSDLGSRRTAEEARAALADIDSALAGR